MITSQAHIVGTCIQLPIILSAMTRFLVTHTSGPVFHFTKWWFWC